MYFISPRAELTSLLFLYCCLCSVLRCGAGKERSVWFSDVWYWRWQHGLRQRISGHGSVHFTTRSVYISPAESPLRRANGWSIGENQSRLCKGHRFSDMARARLANCSVLSPVKLEWRRKERKTHIIRWWGV